MLQYTFMICFFIVGMLVGACDNRPKEVDISPSSVSHQSLTSASAQGGDNSLGGNSQGNSLRVNTLGQVSNNSVTVSIPISFINSTVVYNSVSLVNIICIPSLVVNRQSFTITSNITGGSSNSFVIAVQTFLPAGSISCNSITISATDASAIESFSANLSFSGTVMQSTQGSELMLNSITFNQASGSGGGMALLGDNIINNGVSGPSIVNDFRVAAFSMENARLCLPTDLLPGGFQCAGSVK